MRQVAVSWWRGCEKTRMSACVRPACSLSSGFVSGPLVDSEPATLALTTSSPKRASQVTSASGLIQHFDPQLMLGCRCWVRDVGGEAARFRWRVCTSSTAGPDWDPTPGAGAPGAGSHRVQI